MSEEIKLHLDEFFAKLDRRIATSSKSALEVAAQQMRGIHKQLIAITPPGHSVDGAGVTGGTRQAQEHGKAKVAGDIHRLYGTASGAFKAIYEKSPHQARAFYRFRNSDTQIAAAIVRDQLGAGYGPFDGGALHKTMWKGGAVRGRKRAPTYYVQGISKIDLDTYIARQQNRVMYLTSGWQEIMLKLGIPLPGWINSKNGKGAGIIEHSSTRIHILGSNDVPYASENIRLQWAIDAQSGAMEREWQNWNDKRNLEFSTL